MRTRRGRAVGALLLALAACAAPATPGTASTTAPGPTTPSMTTPGATATHTAARTATPAVTRTLPPGPVVLARQTYRNPIPLPSGCVTVGPSIVGVKVLLVQRALRLTDRRERYDSVTVAAVRSFQQRRGLPVTGLVDRRTWTALGIREDFCIDRWTQQPTVAGNASAATRTAAMITWAKARRGVPYVWGGAGPPKYGFDCSGLALQAMYAGGRIVPGVTTRQHISATFNTAKAIYASPTLQHVAFSKRRPGDLVFWGRDFSHMAIYLGNDQVVEAVRPAVRIASVWGHGTLYRQPYVARPFPG